MLVSAGVGGGRGERIADRVDEQCSSRGRASAARSRPRWVCLGGGAGHRYTVPMSMGSTRLFLVRHGEVEVAWRGRIYGSLDVPLSEHGRTEGIRVACALRGAAITSVVSSGLERTEHVARCLREQRGLARADDPDLRELDRGEWAGRTPQELEACWPGAWAAWFASPANGRPPGGESLNDLLKRVLPRLDHWTRMSPGHSVALVTHGWVLRVLVCHVLGAPLDSAPRLDVRTGDIVAMRWPVQPQAGAAVLEAFALDVAHPQLSE